MFSDTSISVDEVLVHVFYLSTLWDFGLLLLKPKLSNSYYYEIVNEFYSYYWKILNSISIYPTKLSWKYDRDKLCESLFIKEEKIISINSDVKQISFKDGVLKRIKEKGFSEQINIDELINEVINSISVPGKTNESFALTTSKNGVTISWSSNSNNIK